MLEFFAKFIESELGIIYAEHNLYQLEKRLRDICTSLEIVNEDALFHKAQSEGITGHFKSLLLDIATNNETSFFRDQKLWLAIEKHLYPLWRESNPTAKTFNAWSAACSFGQEPYSLAMKFSEMRNRDPNILPVNILATDISSRALEKAKSGQYSQLEVQRGMPISLLIKYFRKDEKDIWVINDEIKKQVQFQSLNLLNLARFAGKFDLILMRNILIYQNSSKKKSIISNLSNNLCSNGFLVLGSAESLIGLSDGFEQIIKDGAVIFRQRSMATSAA